MGAAIGGGRAGAFGAVFGNRRRPLIGVVHLAPLPGSPRYAGSMARVIERALADAEKLARGGLDALIVENFGDAPFYPSWVPRETVAALASAAAAVARAVSIPVGVNALRNDGAAAVACAVAAGASFVRVNVLTGAAVGDQGILEGCAHEVARLRADLRAPGLAVLADVSVKHAASLAARPIGQEAKDAVERGLADAVILSGPRTGEPADLARIADVRRAVAAPILVGSGVRADSVAGVLKLCDGVIVGTALETGGRSGAPVDSARVKAFVAAAKRNGTRYRFRRVRSG